MIYLVAVSERKAGGRAATNLIERIQHIRNGLSATRFQHRKNNNKQYELMEEWYILETHAQPTMQWKQFDQTFRLSKI